MKRLTVVFEVADGDAAQYLDIADKMIALHAYAEMQDRRHWTFDMAMRPVAAVLDDGKGHSGRDAARLPVDSESAARLIFEALGAASTCWENLAGAGLFESTKCALISQKLMTDLGYELPPGYRTPTPDGNPPQLDECGNGVDPGDLERT